MTADQPLRADLESHWPAPRVARVEDDFALCVRAGNGCE